MLSFRNSLLEGTRAVVSYLSTNTARFCVSGSELKLNVLHDRQNQCFTINLDNAGSTESAILRYNHEGNGRIHLLSTTVPESFRGRGVAAHLAKAAMDFVVNENLKANVSCWYIKKYVDENPHLGYKNHVVD
ncbi:protein NATD1 [Chanos chanos]|uniref:Protein NATD1 n=1 Tax=Chanos chanos TaxID=29144 RepID=A0A6J2WRL4_CHACN|nr:protein NATD1-like [Chanos chanos]